MRLRKRFRVNTAISFGAILLLAGVMGLSWRASTRANDAHDVAAALQQEILEQGIAREEYLMYRDVRAKAQWETKTARLDELLGRAAALFDRADEREKVN